MVPLHHRELPSEIGSQWQACTHRLHPVSQTNFAIRNYIRPISLSVVELQYGGECTSFIEGIKEIVK